MDDTKLTENDRRALAIYNELRQQNEQKLGEVKATPMLAKDAAGNLNFDLRKADANCEHCRGRGFRSEPIITGTGIETQIIVCRCVARNGGVNDRPQQAYAFPLDIKKE